jgi:hypothetical protein
MVHLLPVQLLVNIAVLLEESRRKTSLLALVSEGTGRPAVAREQPLD